MSEETLEMATDALSKIGAMRKDSQYTVGEALNALEDAVGHLIVHLRNREAEAKLAAHARRDIPDLLAEVEALASDNATMRDGLARLECRVLQELVLAQPENKAPLEAIWRIARAALSGEEE